MNPNDNPNDEQPPKPLKNEDPQIFALTREAGGYKLERRSFLKAAAVMATADMSGLARGESAASSEAQRTFEGNRMLLPEDDMKTRPPAAHTGEVYSMAFSPDGKWLASGSLDGVKLWSMPDGKFIIPPNEDNNYAEAVAFRPDGKQVAAGGFHSSITLWPVPSRRLRVTLEGHRAIVRSVAFSPDGKLLASASEDKTVKVWSVAGGNVLASLNGKLLLTLAESNDGMVSVAFSPDGKWLAAGCRDHTVKLWSMPDGTLHATLRGHENGIGSVAFSPDGKLLVSGGGNPVIKFWSMPGNVPLAETTGFSQLDYAEAVAFSPDGKWLAVGGCANIGGGNTIIRLLPVPHGPPQVTLVRNTGNLKSLAFSPDGKLLAAGYVWGCILLWEIGGHKRCWALFDPN